MSAVLQGLGKTVQMLALIVSPPPTEEDAQKAMKWTEHEQRNMQQHVLSARRSDCPTVTYVCIHTFQRSVIYYLPYAVRNVRPLAERHVVYQAR